MQIGIYNPYFDSLGGGERYTLTLAEHWSKHNTVDLFWDDGDIASKASSRFHLNLDAVRVVPNIFNTSNIVKRFQSTREYDLIFILSDGSIPTVFSKRAILHFQVPFAHIYYPWWKRCMYQAIVCNSSFTKHSIDQSIGPLIHCIYPPVDIQTYSSGKKQKTILSVGRFTSYHESKKQEVLIEAFKEIVQNPIARDWRLILIGGLLPTDESYYKRLVQQAEGFPIDFYPNCSYLKLQEFYKISTLYWHAAGFGETKPEFMEHFGISTVESMASGCVPIVFNGGGQKEIVNQGVNGFVWNSQEECIGQSIELIKKPVLCGKMRQQAIQTSRLFSKQVFCMKFDALVRSIT